MYHSFFGLDEQAFSIAVNPRYLFMSSQHREALAHLTYGVNSGGFVMLTGEVGTGKTTTIRCLLEQLPQNTDVAMVLNPATSAGELLCSICDEFGVSYEQGETSLKTLTDKLLAFLLKNHRKGHKSIVLIDEAQLLKVSTLEQVRLLTNLESNTQKLLQIILVGQPELNELLARPALRQLSQRITARYHLRPLNNKETFSYIRHRLAIAGLASGRQLFPPKVINRIHDISGGIPRLINVLCDRMLLGAYSHEKQEVDISILKQASSEVFADGYISATERISSRNIILITACVAVTMACFVVLWLLFKPVAEVVSEPLSNVPLSMPEHQPQISRDSQTKAVAETPKDPSDKPDNKELLEPTKFWVSSKDRALYALFEVMGENVTDAPYPCWSLSKKGKRCETLKASTWTELAIINRPAVLHLNTPSRFSAFATLIGFDENTADMIFDGEIVTVPLKQLSDMWTGEYTFVWHKPPGFERAVGSGSFGPVVEWLAKQFAELDGQQRPLATTKFTEALAARVKIFQKQNQLKQDGLVGMQTLLRLNEHLGLDITLRQRPAQLLIDQVQRTTGGL